MDRKLICDILKSEMNYATGCTEPAAIALCAAYAKEYLQEDVQSLDIYASVNIIKNAMSAGIPGTDKTGINYAAAIGAIAGGSKNELLVIDHASKEDINKAIKLVDNNLVHTHKKDINEKLYIEIIAKGSNHTVTTIIAAGHTNLVYVKKDDEIIIDHPINKKVKGVSEQIIEDTLSFESILEFVNGITDEDDLEVIKDAIRINDEISKAGLNNEYNLAIGKHLDDMCKTSIIKDGLFSSIVKNTAAGIDARMAGANYPVVTNSGSGNQGITCTIPVLTYGRENNFSEEETFKAVTLSHLVAIYIHCNFGLLSALCGATIASTAAACGLVYLMGGSIKEMNYVVNNMLGTLSGMICDGAKPDCSLKISSCIGTAFLSSCLAMRGITIKSNEGIVSSDAQNTVKSFVKISDDSSSILDNSILDIMLNKK